MQNCPKGCRSRDEVSKHASVIDVVLSVTVEYKVYSEETDNCTESLNWLVFCFTV